MSSRAVNRRCRALVRDLEITSPLDVRALCDRVAQHTGRPIRLESISLPPDGPCGLWVAVGETDYIFYEQETSPLHQEHIIAHELGHVLCDHRTSAVVGEESSLLILPNLDPRMVQRVLRRTQYNSVEEQEAEVIASLILQEAHRRTREPTWTVPSGSAEVIQRLDRSLRHIPKGGR
ncbi:ImmA/IrrE family metallo-endopeptidase [Streptomyces inhibens]|uniref:ImmA/IrrE family metallo-endopeptidase n=1 Tax=Streptomyces inhibens TaxID=2293571 RepID=A0A371PS87_STRIH|nr:ImmA/IrrE family metallo-endopeptidase [Streptomyces inhibens]